jgi:hypothetical protein
MTNASIRTAAAVALAMACSLATLAATERRPLPELTVSMLDGTAVTTADLASEGHWLLIYVEPACGSCAAVLGAMTREDHPGKAQRVTVVVGGATLEQANALASSATELADARWVVDTGGTARQLLGVRSSPTVMGVRTRSIEWALTGVLRRNSEMESVLVSWLNQRRP